MPGPKNKHKIKGHSKEKRRDTTHSPYSPIAHSIVDLPNCLGSLYILLDNTYSLIPHSSGPLPRVICWEGVCCSTIGTPPTTAASGAIHADTSPGRCLTFEEDGFTQCGQPATEGHPEADRCKVHHGQYRTLSKKYKDASKVVDGVKDGADLPTKEQINHYTDWHAALAKACWVRKYLEVIRVEKTGREIHQTRFFLKVDDGHRCRLKLLEREMVKVMDVLDALQGKAYELYHHGNAPHAMNDTAPSAAEVELGKQAEWVTEEVLNSTGNPEAHFASVLGTPRKSHLPVGDEDLVDMSLRDQKERMMAVLDMFIHFESGPETQLHEKSMLENQNFLIQQFARRIIFHEPTLFMKSLGKVSFKDLILSDDFSMEDVAKLLLQLLEFPLKWFKNAVLDALVMSRYGTAANVCKIEDRIPLLGGWVFSHSHLASMPNAAWFFLLKVLEPPANIENRFVRLCSNFEDLVGFLSFAAFGLVPSPTFCQSPPHFDADDPALSRNALSLSGVIVADMVSTPRPPYMCGPLPTFLRARQPDCMVWTEVETRAYMFGALPHERGKFVKVFLSELRARPDLFQVVLRSETDPGRRVEMFGSGPSNNEALPAIRVRQFVAHVSLSHLPPPSSLVPWKVEWSAMDVLYGMKGELKGYLILEREPEGWFFRFKTFPVTYFVILDTVPNRSRSVLARNVAWAALRAGGYARGEYTLRKYAAASDKLFERRAQERLGWLPKELWGITKLKDQLHRDSVAAMFDKYTWFMVVGVLGALGVLIASMVAP